MDVQDGFIVGIFNYCDRWCERCALTSYCRLFADSAEFDFEAAQGPLTEPKAERDARQLALHVERWERDHGLDFAKIEEEVRKELDKSDDDDEADLRYEPKVEHLELRERAMDFGHDTSVWLEGRSSAEAPIRDALEVLAHFAYYVPPKVHRALSGIRDDEEWGSCGDTEGSAKAAILALERMRAAWELLIERDYLSRDVGASFIDGAGWLIAGIERAVPRAREFVRPGFDEPDELARLRE